MSIRVFKGVLHRAGLYPLARSLHHRVDASARAERKRMIQFYKELISPGDLCFDIGANVGQSSEAMLVAGASVVALEPNTLCRPVLDWQFKRNRRFTLVEKAVGAEPGSAVLNFNGTDSTASLRGDWFSDANNDSRVVEITTIDALIAEFGRPRLCKVDVEGFEVPTFNGLSQPIPIVCFEMNRYELDNARRILSRLASLGEITSINLIDMDHHSWLSGEYLRLNEFLDQFEERPPHVGNIVLKMSCP